MTQKKLIYAIGDIHGDFEQLLTIHARIEKDLSDQDNPDYEIIHIGDLVDRRPDSKGVIDYLMDGISAGKPWIVIKGNHDRLFQWFLETPHRKDPSLRPDYNWLTPRMGGQDTLMSYGMNIPEGYDIDTIAAEAKKTVPKAHYDFLAALPFSYEIDECFFVHAGVNPKFLLSEQTEDDMLWIRKGFLEYNDPYEKMVIHGHTPVDEVTHYGNRINIDTGAAWGDALSAIVIDDGTFWNLLPEARAPLLRA